MLLYTVAASAQNDVLLFQKKGKTKHTFFNGRYISLQTRQGNFADGIITRIQQDTVYLRHFEIMRNATEYGGIYFDTVFRYTTAIHYKDIGALFSMKDLTNRVRNGTILMIAGAGVLALGAINGLYRGEPPRDWYEPASFITAGALTGLGILMRRSARNKTVIGKKYTLKILPLDRR